MDVTVTITTGTDTITPGAPRIASFELLLKHENGQVYSHPLAADETAFVFLDVPAGDYTVEAQAYSLAGVALGAVATDTITISAEDAVADVDVATLASVAATVPA